MNPYKKLLNNSLIFAVGNFGSRIISLLLVPLYTYHLSTSEYGSVDILITTTRMLLPVISLSIFESVLRYVMDKNHENSEIITNSVIITTAGATLFLLTYPFLKVLHIFDGFLIYMYVILILQVFQSIFSQYARAVGKLRIFAINGILMTVLLGTANIVLLVLLNYGVKGYLMSIVISNAVSIIFLGFSLKINTIFKFNKFNRELSKEMMFYCMPLIPNALLWWIMSASNRYLILYFIGASANGVYAIAQKIPSVLAIVSTIFSQSWQLSAIEEYNSDDRSKFYSKVFNYYSLVMLITVSSILVMLKIVLKNTVAFDYYLAWEVVPFLLLGSVFNSFSVFLGTNYIAAKETKGVFSTTIFGSFITVVLGTLLIPFIGLKGAGISIMLSSAIMWLIRVVDTRKYIKMSLDLKNLLFSLGIIIIQIVVLHLQFRIFYEFLILLVLFFVLIITNKSSLMSIFKFIRKK